MTTPRFWTLCSMILLAAISRLMPHPWNVTPVAAMALFAGAHLEKKSLAFLVPLAALFLSDIFIGFHNTMPFVYAGFALTVVLGRGLSLHGFSTRLGLASVSSSLMFFLITNFGSWLTDPMYVKSLSGLTQSYVAALPFLRNSLFGDLFYTSVLFGSFAFLQKRVPQLRLQPR